MTLRDALEAALKHADAMGEAMADSAGAGPDRDVISPLFDNLHEIRTAIREAMDAAKAVDAVTTKSGGWGWCRKGEEEGQWSCETYASRDEAVAAAAKDCEPGTVVYVAEAEYPDPADFCEVDLDDLIQRAEESAADTGWYAEEELFIPGDGAEEALKAAMRAWAEKYVTADLATFQDMDEVTL